MSIVRVNIIVEGQTEETFVRDILAVPLAMKEVIVTARRVESSRKQNMVYRGGLSDYKKVRNDIQRWLTQDSKAFVTTMFDLYALPSDFPDYAKAKSKNEPYEQVAHLETAFGNDIANRRFLPYLQLHEFEGLLFSDITVIDSNLTAFDASRITQLHEIDAEFDTPELINDSVETAPSKRLLRLYPSYNKVVFGSLIAEEIGLQKIRQSCPHFNQWLIRLESLAENQES